jgi:hypothetical protein
VEDKDVTWKTIGGNNPQSWALNGAAHYSLDPADWTAFIFSLSDSKIFRQTHLCQTFNHPSYGPTFADGMLRPRRLKRKRM